MKIKKILCFLLAAVLVIEGGEGLVSRGGNKLYGKLLQT